MNEILGARLLTVHNLHRYAAFMREMRASIAAGTFEAFRRRVLAEYDRVLDGHGERKEDGT